MWEGVSHFPQAPQPGLLKGGEEEVEEVVDGKEEEDEDGEEERQRGLGELG